MRVVWRLRGAVGPETGEDELMGPSCPLSSLKTILHPSGRSPVRAQWPAQASGRLCPSVAWGSHPGPDTHLLVQLPCGRRQRVGAPDPPLLPALRPLVPPLPLSPPLPLPLQPLPPPLPGSSPSLPSPTRDPGRCCWAGPPGLSPAPRRAAAAAPFAEEEASGRGAGRGA